MENVSRCRAFRARHDVIDGMGTNSPGIRATPDAAKALTTHASIALRSVIVRVAHSATCASG
jgi:hypothetical protein